MEGQPKLNPETLTGLTTALNPNLSPEDKKSLLNTLLSFPDVFSNSLGHTSVALHNIDTGNSPPIRQYPRRLPYHHRAEVDKQVNDMLSQGAIQPSTSPWSSPIVLVKKKDGSYRFCIDYRKLNSITKIDAHPLPRVDDLLEALNGNTIYSTLDLRSGNWQVGMHPGDCEKTAFSTPGGLYEFLRLPYGLSNAPATFSRAIGIVLSGLTYTECLCYFDDVIIFSKTMSEHCMRLTSVLSRFSTRRIFPRAAERLLYLHCLFLTMVASSRSATRVFESRIDFNFSAASKGANQSNRSKALTNDINTNTTAFKMADQVEYRYSKSEMEAMMAMASRSDLFFPDSASTVEAANPQEFDKELFLEEVC